LSPSRILSALSKNRAVTHPKHDDPHLRGRTYAVPFATVWRAAVELASGGLLGWTVREADEGKGVLSAESKTLVFRFVDDVQLRMSLDENGQTRVDMISSSRSGRGDLGKNARRVRKFFRVLDKKIGAGPREILDPNISIPRAVPVLLLLPFLLFACSPDGGPPPAASPPEGQPDPAGRNFQGRSYERHIVFLTAQGDSTLIVPWSFTARTRPGGVDRSIRGWLARSDTWDPFVADEWETPPTNAPWRILPRGRARIIVGQGDALERIFFEEGARRLEVVLEDLQVEWTGRRAQTFRVHRGATLLSSGQVEGFVLDMSRAWSAEDPPPGDWAFLLSGDSLQVVLEDQSPGSAAEGGAFHGWGRIDSVDVQWESIQLSWSQTRSFEPSRRDVPMSWGVLSEGQGITGELDAVSPFLEVGEGEGPMLPVDALYQVSGTLVLDGLEFPVRGLIRHRQH
jgi:hypothetical protein